MIRSAVKSIIHEFVVAGVIPPPLADELLHVIESDMNPWYTGKEYADTFAYVTLMMLKHMKYVPRESSPIRQALADLFVENPVEHQKLMGGDQKLAGFFMGRAMKVSRNFNPKDVQKRISEMVAENKETYEWETV